MTNKQDISDHNYQRLQERARREGCSVDDLLTQLLDNAPAPSQPQIPYHLLLKHANDGVSLFDTELRYVYVNPIVGELVGRDPAAMIGKTNRELDMPAPNLRHWRNAWDRVVETRQEQVITFNFPTPQEQRTFESRITPIYDESHTLIYLLVITRDVTEREQAVGMLRDITDRLPGMILSYRLYADGTDEVPYVSEGVYKIYEVTVEDALEDITRVWSKVHPDDLGNFAKSIQESAETLSLWDYEWRIRMNDGSIKWVAGLGTPRRLDDGSTMWNTLLLDITERKRLQDQQEELLEQFQQAITTAKLGIWKLDLENDVLEWNDQQLQIYGVSREDFNGRVTDWSDRVHPDDIVEADARLQEALFGKEVFDLHFRIIRDDGEIRHINASANVIRDSSGRAKTVIGINVDITDLKQAEQATFERERLIANLNMEKDRMETLQRIVAKLNHDIRIPLSVISTSQEILSRYFERIDIEQRQERLETIGKQLGYVSELLEDLSDISEISADERPLQLLPHNLTVLFEVMLQQIQGTIGKNHNFIFNHQFASNQVLIDDTLINRIALNLLTNAVKYSSPGSDIIINLRDHDDRIILQVIDEGVGISEEDLPLIFDPNYRVPAIEDAVEGNGLGLSIVKDCVKRHNGQIHVESVLGQGTTFTIELPLTVPAEQSA